MISREEWADEGRQDENKCLYTVYKEGPRIEILSNSSRLASEVLGSVGKSL